MLGQNKLCGATRLDAAHPLYTYSVINLYMLTFIYRESYSVSHTPFPFLFALRSPFISRLFATLSPPAALCTKVCRYYSLFFTGFVCFTTLKH